MTTSPNEARERFEIRVADIIMDGKIDGMTANEVTRLVLEAAHTYTAELLEGVAKEFAAKLPNHDDPLYDPYVLTCKYANDLLSKIIRSHIPKKV